MRIRPCIDIHNGKVKQIVGSSLRDRSEREDGTAKENFSTDLGARYYAFCSQLVSDVDVVSIILISG